MSGLFVPVNAAGAGGGGGSSLLDPRPMFPASLHATYGDDFAGASIAGKWGTAGGSPSSALAILGQSWATISHNAAGAGSGGAGGGAGSNGIATQTPPAGDFTIRACLSTIGSPGVMPGLAILDSAGTGVAVHTYDSSIGVYCSNILTYAYNTGLTGVVKGADALQQQGAMGIYELAKVGTTYTGRFSWDGRTWLAVNSRTGPASPTAMGFGRLGRFAAGNLCEVRCDWFDLI